jgi:hypothetical protein
MPAAKPARIGTAFADAAFVRGCINQGAGFRLGEQSARRSRLSERRSGPRGLPPYGLVICVGRLAAIWGWRGRRR